MDGLRLAAHILFALSLAGLLAVFPLYPAATWLLARLRRRAPPAVPGPDLPTVSLITVARNAGALIGAKLDNALALDWPAGRLEILAWSDGSTDDTGEEIRKRETRGVRALGCAGHLGKAHGLNAAAAASTGEILVFTDADALLEPGALRALAEPFADPRVGGVCGQRVLARDDAPLHDAQQTYVDLDSRIKAFEDRLGRLTSNDGKLYAVRRELFRPIDAGSTDDLYEALCVIAQGRDFRFAPGARARVRLPSRNAVHELARRRRIVARSLRGIALHARLLNPVRFGWFAVGLLVNKVFRRLLPLFLLGMLGASTVLATAVPVHGAFLVLAAAGLLLAALEPPLRRWSPRGLPTRLAGRARYALVGQCGMLLGVLDFLRGRTVDRWEPQKSAAPPPAAPPPPPERPIAYIVSRFPRITETFVLYEILELERQGLPVLVFPLMRGREVVQHPEVERLAPRVRQHRLLSPAVLAANAALLCERPRAYLRAAFECLAGTIGSLRFFAGALAFFPKAVWFAREMRRAGVRHVHAHFAHHPALAALVVHRLTGIPFSFTAHGSDLHMEQRMLDRKIAAAAFAVTISDYNRKFVRERCGAAAADRLRVVRCGIDPEVFSPRPEGADPARFTLLCVAALRGVKGHRHLIEACRLLAARGTDFAAHLVGDGPLRRELAARIRAAGLENRVTLHGALPRADVVRHMAAASVVVLPSIVDSRGRREGIPVVLMEAMACGLPVVASRLSGIPELVEPDREGLLVEPGDPAALADALARLAGDPELRARLGQAARVKVLAQYDQRTNAARLAELIRGAGDPRQA